MKRLWNATRPALIVTRREVRDQLRDWRIIFPVLFLTIFFPFLMNFTAQQVVGFAAQYGAELVGERMIPFLLMIVGFFPISVSLVIALETFVGEKERGSIEPLLSSPLKDWQLYLGKLLAATVPPLCSSFIGMAVYLGGLAWKGITLPDPGMLFQVAIMTSVQALVMVSAAVVISTQATSVRAANLLASFVIIPVALLIQGESIVMFWGNTSTLWWIIFGLTVLSTLLVRVGLAHFQREELLGHEIDVLNFRWGWRVFRQSFRMGARSVGEWYRVSVFPAVRSLTWPLILVGGVLVAGFIIGMDLSHTFFFPIDRANVSDLREKLGQIQADQEIFPSGLIPQIWWQNVRVLIISLVLGIFSFGILGLFPPMISLAAVGYLEAILSASGIPGWAYLAGLILPHGILEIPAIALASAAVLKMGAVLATPTPGKTVGEVWLAGLADWVKIMLGIVIPLLLVAACVEVWVTPRLALLVFH